MKAIDAAVRFYEEPPTEPMTVATDWSDIWLSADDWAEAFDAPEPGTPHNEAREQIWELLLTILMDKYDGDVAGGPAPKVVAAERRIAHDPRQRVDADRGGRPRRETCGRYPPTCASARPGSAPTTFGSCNARTPRAGRCPTCRCWTQHGSGSATRRRHDVSDGTTPPSPPNASSRSMVVDDLIAADDSEMMVMSMLRGEDLQNALVDETALPSTDPDLLAGPFAHVVVDEAQELTDAEWQMLLLRCPSRSFTIVGDRAQARHGFTESWQERLERIGLDRIDLASLSINYRTPEEVMAEAEPVIRAVLPDANVPTSIRSSDIPVVHGSASDLDSILDTWLAANADGIACVIGDPDVPGDVPRPVADPGAVEGARVRPGRPRRPRGVRHGHRRSGRPLRRHDPGDPATRHPHELLITLCRAVVNGPVERAALSDGGASPSHHCGSALFSVAPPSSRMKCRSSRPGWSNSPSRARIDPFGAEREHLGGVLAERVEIVLVDPHLLWRGDAFVGRQRVLHGGQLVELADAHQDRAGDAGDQVAQRHPGLQVAVEGVLVGVAGHVHVVVLEAGLGGLEDRLEIAGDRLERRRSAQRRVRRRPAPAAPSSRSC